MKFECACNRAVKTYFQVKFHTMKINEVFIAFSEMKNKLDTLAYDQHLRQSQVSNVIKSLTLKLIVQIYLLFSYCYLLAIAKRMAVGRTFFFYRKALQSLAIYCADV